MEILSGLLSALPGIIFWSFVLSFIPNAFYCILRDSRSYKDEIASIRGIYVIIGEQQRKRENKSYWRGIFIIYAVCFLIFILLSIWNWFSRGQVTINPFDMLSSTSVVLFWFAVLSYIPFLIYLAVKEPRQYMEERARFHGIFLAYGICLLAFCFVYSYHWMQSNQIPLSIKEIFSSIAIILTCSAILSYIPIILYLFTKALYPNKRISARSSVIFSIYSICFLLFSSIYVYNWIVVKKLPFQ